VLCFRNSSIDDAGTSNRLESVERLDDGKLENVCRRKRSWPVASDGSIIILAGLRKMTRFLVQIFPYKNQEGYQHKGKV
jgi:hypothetical protein